jgi:hypothetical protein
MELYTSIIKILLTKEKIIISSLTLSGLQKVKWALALNSINEVYK